MRSSLYWVVPSRLRPSVARKEFCTLPVLRPSNGSRASTENKREQKSSLRSYDAEAGERLWRISEQLTGLTTERLGRTAHVTLEEARVIGYND